MLLLWLIYVADRILDTLTIGSGRAEATRHRYFRAHRRAFIAPFVLVSGIAAWTADSLDSKTLFLGAALMFVVAAYFLVVHIFRTNGQVWFPKEAVVAIVFGLGTYLPLARVTGANATVLAPVILFVLSAG